MTDAQFQELLSELRLVRFLIKQFIEWTIEAVKKPEPKRALSFKWMTINEVADHFCVSAETVRIGRHEFVALRRANVGGRTIILRADVCRLDRELERLSVAPIAGVVPGEL